MTLFHISVDIAASPERVWTVMSDAARWPEWTPTVTSIELLDPGPWKVGSRARIRQPKLPPAVWRMTEFNQGTGFTWITGGPFVRVTARHWIESLPAGSRATLSIRFSGLFGALAARLTRNLNETYLALEAQGLKARSESG